MDSQSFARENSVFSEVIAAIMTRSHAEVCAKTLSACEMSNEMSFLARVQDNCPQMGVRSRGRSRFRISLCGSRSPCITTKFRSAHPITTNCKSNAVVDGRGLENYTP
jgi:hypothetical protein